MTSLRTTSKKLGLFVMEKIENATDSLLSYHMRPRRAARVGTWSDRLTNEPKTAIVIQGPILKDHDFTLETVKIYRKIFPRALIVLSTWESERPEELEKFRKENAEIVLTQKPAFAGQQNINLQIVSSRSGIEKAKSLGAHYGIKTRTDQRMYASGSLEYLRNLLEAFPLTHSSAPASAKKIQKKRIIGTSLNTFKYRPYGLSDMTIFGDIDDLLLYWSPALDDRTIPKDSLTRSTGEFAHARVCEIYLATEFLKKVGHEPKMTLADSWLAFSRHFCVVDQISLDMYWYKYGRQNEHRSIYYDAIRNSQNMTFAEWLSLCVNAANKADVPEKTLDDVFGSPIEEKTEKI